MTTDDMPPSSLPLELTLVVAATSRDMGIGANGGLPWTGLRKEMAYFARVTKRGQNNAVIMGRRTWESIPAKFRPLRGRLNVVVSRSFAPGMPRDPVGGPDAGPVEASSLEAALAYLRARKEDKEATSAVSMGPVEPDRVPVEASSGGLGRVYVIGGAQIYAAALGLPEARRILLTRVLSDFSCDTFFPLALGAETASPVQSSASAWVRQSRAAHGQWIGEEVPEGVQSENGIEYEFQMWERVD
ncbi:dihydrofolate reductase [Niveomyces insectorum RCEF 264]|uniref:Dihydrofolate reductase n=1 Tax=Niveomyces insectorum RCEF 264 TaxID=1081102 RepID=A0A167RG64_9HYPO|nr:dihydrofolate reductase [Niveomyces insectorum RCEF 264]